MSPPPHLALGAAVIAAILCHCTADVSVPQPTITPSTDDLCVPENPTTVAYTCTGPVTVQWFLGDYLAVDTSQFSSQGIPITNGGTTKDLTIEERGFDFFFDNFNDTNFTISCVSVRDSVFLNRTDRILVYRNFPPVADPSWEVTGCNDDGTLTLRISYEPIQDDDKCVNSNITYTLSLSNGVRQELREDPVWEGRVDNTEGLSATLEVSDGIYTRTTVTELTNVTCCAPVFCRCEETCNGPSDGVVGDWSYEFASVDGLVGVRDIRPDGSMGGQMRLPSSESDDCSCPNNNTPDPRQCPSVGFLVLTAILGLLLGTLIGALTVVIIMKCCLGQGSKHEKISATNETELSEKHH